jgi:hypothetical protein
MLEDQGLATTVIGLVRPHMEKTANPRGLFVPFLLGRPLGEPGDAMFQRRVLLAALGLLERADGPVILADFPDDAPTQAGTPSWRPAVALPPPAAPTHPAEWAAALATEIALLQPAWQQAQARFGRSTVGLSGLAPEVWPSFASAFLGTAPPAAPAGFASAALALRYLADDLKAFYAEAAQASGAAPAPDQASAWLFRETLAGRLLLALRTAALAGEDGGFKTMAGRFLIPVPFLPPA